MRFRSGDWEGSLNQVPISRQCFLIYRVALSGGNFFYARSSRLNLEQIYCLIIPGMARRQLSRKTGGVKRVTRQLESSSLRDDIALHRVGQSRFGGSAKGQTELFQE
jgi:hypothetical protein